MILSYDDLSNGLKHAAMLYLEDGILNHLSEHDKITVLMQKIGSIYQHFYNIESKDVNANAELKDSLIKLFIIQLESRE